jgi:hypothetical protein
MTQMSQERESPPDAAPAAEETLTFRFHDGKAWRCVDPWRVERLLRGQPVSRVIEEARQPVDAIAAPALEALLSAACLAFGLTPVQEDGSGHTEKTQVRVLTEFLRWKESVKKKGESTPSLREPTAPASSPAPPPNGMPRG